MERGRPRIFDEEQALDAALGVFWRSGYQGASLAELTHAMGISKPSLYAAFGNKEKLFLTALQRYREQQLNKHAEALAAEPDLKKAMRAFLRSVATMLTAPELPGGCLVVNSAVACDISVLPQGVVAAIGKTVDQSSFDFIERKTAARTATPKFATTYPCQTNGGLLHCHHVRDGRHGESGSDGAAPV